MGVRLDMTPMVDVAFLLLTFFMLTTQFRPAETLPVVLPGSHAASKAPGGNLLTITVTSGGVVFVGADVPPGVYLPGLPAGPLRDVRVAMKDLPLLLVRLRSTNPALQTLIKADRGVSYGPVEDVMKALQVARISRFALVTDLERQI